MKIKKNDNIIVISGKDRGKKGKVIKVFLDAGKILIDGINLIKKHNRPKKSGEKGQIIEIPAPIDASNVKIICPKCGKPSRVEYNLTKAGKFRMCKKCGQEI
jgi:large subunit ribosomal protein L24